MTELEIIERLRRRVPLADRNLVLGIGDDCAIYQPPWNPGAPGEELVFTTDLLLEGTHFRPGTSARFAGAKALARGLSDIAAMGAEPRFCLLSLGAPSAEYIEEFYTGVLEVAVRWRTGIAGGDLSRSDRVLCDVVVCGGAPRGMSLRRGPLSGGHELYVSGPLGRAASRDYDDVPEPRIPFGLELRGHAVACMDVSDGLALDLHRMLKESGVAAELDEVPVFPGATTEHALFGGEDYELLFAAEIGTRVPGMRIGRVVNGPPGVITWQGQPVEPRGYDHFA